MLVSATGFGTLAIFAKIGYRAGLGTEQTLAFRFGLAAVGMWILAVAVGQNPLRLSRRRVAIFFVLGAAVYTA
ncbi:MAG TPA: EamA/RhaT family transporter, partial [Patescibacteria group bacterium]|nr:EamA/RhaT family transporter [Patescibacteria group bacterium]